MRKTKIVCTMGPRESDDNILKELVKEMDVARFNFSHGTHESHLEMLQRVRAAADEAGRPIAMLLDTKGPEIRTGLLEGHQPVKLVKDSIVLISPMAPAVESGNGAGNGAGNGNGTSGQQGNAEHLFVTYENIANDLSVGDTVLMDDGVIEMKVTEIEGQEIKCKVSVGGMLGERKGVNLPGINVGLPDLTDKDYEDITFGLANGFDYIAASFIRNAEAVNKIRSLVEEAGASTKIIAKIESGEGIENLKEIIDAADGIMVARGDLGVEVEARRIPQLQREMIAMCNEKGKIVITATQMLDSMMRSPRPTRAEVTDVANAVYEGSDAVMLSGETASGEYPVEALKMMASIAEYTEQFVKDKFADLRGRYGEKASISNTTCIAAVAAAEELDAKAILAPTTSGSTALEVSKCRPDSDIYAFSPDPTAVRQMMLFWGVRPTLAERAHSTDELLEDCLELMSEKGIAEEGDIYVFIAGVVSGRHGYQRSETNTMRIIRM
ncbi:MAG: pyruvate kinase [Clostridiales bacterium]|nr:pyruvate kinase [Clostridiales bacterium]